MSEPKPGAPPRLVVRMPNWLGDAVMALPAVAQVRRAWPEATLALAAPSGLAPLFHERTIAAPDEVVSFEPGGEAAALAAGRFDAILLLPNSIGSAWVARRAGIPERWGYGAGVRRWLLTRSAPRPRGRVHQAEFYRALVRGLLEGGEVRLKADTTGRPVASGFSRTGEADAPPPVASGFSRTGEADAPPSVASGFSRTGEADAPPPVASGFSEVRLKADTTAPAPVPPLITLTEDTAQRAARLLEREGVVPGTALVGFAPGAAYGHAKRWPPDRVAEVIRRLAAERGAIAVLVGSAGDRDAGREIESALPPPTRLVNLIGRTDLRVLAGVLARCAAFVSNDSGAMHLAAGLGVPVTAIFGPTDDRVTSPLGEADVLVHQVFCRPCMLRDCPIDHRCMKGITAAAVFDAVSARLARQPRGEGA
jgi:ADP-heptose:LPS heptosyltransferase